MKDLILIILTYMAERNENIPNSHFKAGKPDPVQRYQHQQPFTAELTNLEKDKLAFLHNIVQLKNVTEVVSVKICASFRFNISL